MKKYIIVLFLITFIIPSVALASWWNPFTWKIFHKPVEPKIEQPIITAIPPVDISTQLIKEEPKKSVEVEKVKKESNQKVTTSIIKEQEVPSVVVETWAELEKRYSAEADQRGDAYMWIKNSLGEKRYYRKEGTQWVQKNSEAESIQPYNNTQITTPIPPPTAQQIADLTRICSYAISQGKLTDICNPTSGVVWSSYYSSLSFRNAFDDLVPKFDAMIANQSAVSAKQLQQTNCDYLLKSGSLALMTPWAGTLAMKEACGTATDADRTNYQITELQHQLSGLQDTINKNKAEAFLRSDLESLQSKPQTFGTTKWEVRFDNGGFGSVSNSLGQSYSFHCDSTSCITY